MDWQRYERRVQQLKKFIDLQAPPVVTTYQAWLVIETAHGGFIRAVLKRLRFVIRTRLPLPRWFIAWWYGFREEQRNGEL